jgi:hypothetical protein
MDNDHPENFYSSPMSPSDFALMAIHGKIWALLKKIYTDTISGCIFPSSTLLKPHLHAHDWHQFVNFHPYV